MRKPFLLWPALVLAACAAAVALTVRLHKANAVIRGLKFGTYSEEFQRLESEVNRLADALAVANKELNDSRRDRDFWRGQARDLRQGQPTPPGPATSMPARRDTDIPGGTRESIIQAILLGEGSNRWKHLADQGIEVSRADFERAIGDLTTSSSDRRRYFAIVRDWAAVDAAGLAAWIAEQPRGRDLYEPTQQLLSAWIQADRDAAQRWIEALPEGERRERAVFYFVQQTAMSDPAGAARWYGMIKSAGLRSALASRIVASWADRDVAAATRWVATLPDGREREQAARSLAFKLVQSDPAAAVEWAGAMKDTATRDATLASLVASWASKDPRAAAEYVTGLPEGKLRDDCLRRFAAQLARDYPVTAMEWAQSIADNRTRESAVTSVAYQWMREDMDAALSWIDAADLDENIQRQLYRSAGNLVERSVRTRAPQGTRPR